MAVGGVGAGIGSGIGVGLDQMLDGVTQKGGTGGVAGTSGVDDAAGGDGAGSFASVLKSKLTDLNAQQVDAAKTTEDVATGRVDDVAQAMMRIEQANVSLQMATQVRNKVIDAYQEVLRMSI